MKGDGKTDNRSKGRLYEGLAEEYLGRRGYRILERNFQRRGGEIDLVARKDGVYVFSEVKTRSPGAIAPPREAVTAQKQRRILLAAQAFLARHGLGDDVPVRLDVVEVQVDKSGKCVVNRLEAAFEA